MGNIESTSGRRARLGKVLLPLISIAVALLAAEALLGGFNLTGYMKPPTPLPGNTWRELLHRRSSVPGLRYELAPNREKYSHGAIINTNSYGMRDDEPVVGTFSVCNVVALGDSFTFGFGVAGEDTYPSVLERLLADHAPGKTVQVLNLGVGGYSSQDQVAVLRHKGMQWDPALIIIGYVLNDPEVDPIQPLARYYQEPEWWQYSNLLRLGARLKYEWAVKTLGGGDYIEYLYAPDREKWSSVLTAFSEIERIAKENGVPVLLVVFPLTIVNDWSNYPYRRLHSQVVKAGTASGFYTIDLYDTYSEHAPAELTVAEKDAHPSSLGHRLAAKAIYKVIQEFDLLQCM